MRRINYENDIKPLTEFRSNAASFVKQVKESKRPLVLTQHGKSTVVLIDVAEYQSIIEKLELLQDIQVSEQQIIDGKYLTNTEVEERLSARYSK